MELIDSVESKDCQNQSEITAQDPYAPVRYNAMTHGILSRLVVLPHEDIDEFERLRNALAEEHLPSGPTEVHLVEDLAAIMWRKRRVLLAENAKINQELSNVVGLRSHAPAKMAAPFQPDMPDKPTDWQNLMHATPENVEMSLKDTEAYRKLLDQISTLLRNGGDRSYRKSLKMLLETDQEAWAEWLTEETYQPTSQGLLEFVEEHLQPYAVSQQLEAKHHAEIKNQVLGEGIRPAYLQNLCRYETHLDRKFERTLAMLIKLKDLRGDI